MIDHVSLLLPRCSARGWSIPQPGPAVSRPDPRFPSRLDAFALEEIVVTRKGKPAAVLVNYAEYERLKETLDVLSDPDLMRQIRGNQQFYVEGGKGLSFEEVFGEPLSPAKKRKR